MNLVWIDLEMTGLIPEKERIIEIATVVTDSNLNILAEGPSLAIKQPDSFLDSMDDWNTDQHGRSGLIDRVRQSDIDESQAMQSTIQFLLKWVKKGGIPNRNHRCWVTAINRWRHQLIRWPPIPDR